MSDPPTKVIVVRDKEKEMFVETQIATPVLAPCEYAVTDFYTCGIPSTHLVTTAEWSMYLCTECHTEWSGQ